MRSGKVLSCTAFALTFLCAIAVAVPGSAQTTQQGYSKGQSQSKWPVKSSEQPISGNQTGDDTVDQPMSEDEEFALFVLGNTVFTLFHELGHAFIHQFSIPVLGREDDAVDGLAAILMIPDEGDDFADELALAAADGHAMASAQGRASELAFWGEHSLDLQRYAAVNCLIYGSDPKGFADFAKEIEMPKGDRQRCPETYRTTLASWEKLLARHERKEGQAGGAVTVRYATGSKEVDADMVGLLKKSKLIAEAAKAVSETFRLKRDIPVTFKSCGQANAFYDPNTGAVTMCYELVNFFGELIIKDFDDRKKGK
jgi:hypothetical protein